MSSEKQLRNKIILITFICSILVIYIHTYNLETYGIGRDSIGFSAVVYWIETFLDSLTRIAVPMFFFISGFLFFRTFDFDKIKMKYVSRIKNILVPYLCWCSIYYFYYVLVTHIPLIKNMMNGGITELSFVAYVRSLWVDSYYTLWFLKNLMIFIMISPIIFIVLKNYKIIPIGTIVVFLLLCNNNFGFFEVPSGFEIYCCGSWIGINYKELALHRNKLATKISIIYIFAMLVTSFQWYNIWTELILLIAIWFALDIFNFSIDFPWWMQITFFTYVAHDILLEGLEKIIFKIFGVNAIIALMDYILMPFITLFILIIIAALGKKATPKLWGVITGNR